MTEARKPKVPAPAPVMTELEVLEQRIAASTARYNASVVALEVAEQEHEAAGRHQQACQLDHTNYLKGPPSPFTGRTARVDETWDVRQERE